MWCTELFFYFFTDILHVCWKEFCCVFSCIFEIQFKLFKLQDKNAKSGKLLFYSILLVHQKPEKFIFLNTVKNVKLQINTEKLQDMKNIQFYLTKLLFYGIFLAHQLLENYVYTGFFTVYVKRNIYKTHTKQTYTALGKHIQKSETFTHDVMFRFRMGSCTNSGAWKKCAVWVIHCGMSCQTPQELVMILRVLMTLSRFIFLVMSGSNMYLQCSPSVSKTIKGKRVLNFQYNRWITQDLTPQIQEITLLPNVQQCNYLCPSTKSSGWVEVYKAALTSIYYNWENNCDLRGKELKRTW